MSRVSKIGYGGCTESPECASCPLTIHETIPPYCHHNALELMRAVVSNATTGAKSSTIETTGRLLLDLSISGNSESERAHFCMWGASVGTCRKRPITINTVRSLFLHSSCRTVTKAAGSMNPWNETPRPFTLTWTTDGIIFSSINNHPNH